jgi:hypothetical protein
MHDHKGYHTNEKCGRTVHREKSNTLIFDGIFSILSLTDHHYVLCLNPKKKTKEKHK